MKKIPLLAVFLLACGGSAAVDASPDAGGDSPPVCPLWSTPMLADASGEWPEDCTSLPAPRIFECGEYWLWAGLQTRFDERPAIVARLGAILGTPAAAARSNAEWAGRLESVTAAS